MLTVFLLKVRAADVSREEFEEYMATERPPLLESIDDVDGYELWFPADDARYDSVETLTFADQEAMERALGSAVAENLHETGSKFVDFDTEELLMMDSACTFGSRAD